MNLHVTLASSAIALAVSTAAVAKPRYAIIDLGVVDGTTSSQAFAASPDGRTVVGRALSQKSNPAVEWTPIESRTALPNLSGRSYAEATGVNAAGIVVGTSATSSSGADPLPVMWQNGAIYELPLPAGQTIGRVSAINASGVAAGSVNSDVDERAALYFGSSAKVIRATTSDGSTMSYATGINDSGLVVGSGTDPNNAALNVGLVYDLNSDTLTSVGALPGDNGALVFGVSNAGYAVGTSMLYQGSGMPFIWTAAGGMVAIPLPLKTTSEGTAYGVNDKGWAVGNAAGLYSIPFLYKDGSTYPLAALLPANSGWDFLKNTSASAMAISDDGTIVGTAVHNGNTHAYRMVLVSAD